MSSFAVLLEVLLRSQGTRASRRGCALRPAPCACGLRPREARRRAPCPDPSSLRPLDDSMRMLCLCSSRGPWRTRAGCRSRRCRRSLRSAVMHATRRRRNAVEVELAEACCPTPSDVRPGSTWISRLAVRRGRERLALLGRDGRVARDHHRHGRRRPGSRCRATAGQRRAAGRRARHRPARRPGWPRRSRRPSSGFTPVRLLCRRSLTSLFTRGMRVEPPTSTTRRSATPAGWRHERRA